jgi:hypothetical protein
MIDKLVEENRVYEYMCNEKLPKEIEMRRRAVNDLQKVLSLPAIDKQDLQEIQNKVHW